MCGRLLTRSVLLPSAPLSKARQMRLGSMAPWLTCMGQLLGVLVLWHQGSTASLSCAGGARCCHQLRGARLGRRDAYSMMPGLTCMGQLLGVVMVWHRGSRASPVLEAPHQERAVATSSAEQGLAAHIAMS